MCFLNSNPRAPLLNPLIIYNSKTSDCLKTNCLKLFVIFSFSRACRYAHVSEKKKPVYQHTKISTEIVLFPFFTKAGLKQSGFTQFEVKICGESAVAIESSLQLHV